MILTQEPFSRGFCSFDCTIVISKGRMYSFEARISLMRLYYFFRWKWYSLAKGDNVLLWINFFFNKTLFPLEGNIAFAYFLFDVFILLSCCQNPNPDLHFKCQWCWGCSEDEGVLKTCLSQVRGMCVFWGWNKGMLVKAEVRMCLFRVKQTLICVEGQVNLGVAKVC